MVGPRLRRRGSVAPGGCANCLNGYESSSGTLRVAPCARPTSWTLWWHASPKKWGSPVRTRREPAPLRESSRRRPSGGEGQLHVAAVGDAALSHEQTLGGGARLRRPVGREALGVHDDLLRRRDGTVVARDMQRGVRIRRSLQHGQCNGSQLVVPGHRGCLLYTSDAA